MRYKLRLLLAHQVLFPSMVIGLLESEHQVIGLDVTTYRVMTSY